MDFCNLLAAIAHKISFEYLMRGIDIAQDGPYHHEGDQRTYAALVVDLQQAQDALTMFETGIVGGTHYVTGHLVICRPLPWWGDSADHAA